MTECNEGVGRGQPSDDCEDSELLLFAQRICLLGFASLSRISDERFEQLRKKGRVWIHPLSKQVEFVETSGNYGPGLCSRLGEGRSSILQCGAQV